MAESSQSDGASARLLVSGFIALAIAVVGYKLSQPGLESIRPVTPKVQGFPRAPIAPGIEALHARLWEDPLLTCYRQPPVANRHGISLEIHPIAKFLPTGKVLLLPVLLPGTPFGNDHEARLRIAYALHCALATSGYVSAFDNRLSYVDCGVQLTTDLGTHAAPPDSAIKNLVSFRVPLHLFRKASPPPNSEPDGSYGSVLVLWINEDLAHDWPLDVVGQILEKLVGSCKSSAADRAVAVLGPNDSDTLSTIYMELSHIANAKARCKPHRLTEFCRSAAVYSPFATADCKPEPSVPRNRDVPAIYRTIGTDDELTEAIFHELRLRDALKDDGTIVLITEADTSYGKSFKPAVDLRLQTDEFKHLELAVKSCRYLRGLDGRLPFDAKEHAAASSHEPGSPAGAGTPTLHEELRPQGLAQRDYLERLQRKLVDLDAFERMRGRPGVVAVGVVGTDIYDKLLVLRALRKHFPKAAFFTTELDAAFNDPDEWLTTRNLLVASHFGLRLNDRLQSVALPFRDSYQTSMYLTSLYVLNQGLPASCRPPEGVDFTNASTLARCRPLVFEIGHDGPYQLTLTRNADERTKVIQPRSPREEVAATAHAKRFVLLVLAAFAIEICVLVFVSDFRRWVVDDDAVKNLKLFVRRFVWGNGLLIGVISLPFILMLVDHRRADGQPFSLTQGISIWPTTTIRYVAFLVGVAFLFSTRRELCSLRQRLELMLGCKCTPALPWNDLFRKRFDWAWRHLFVFNWPEVRSGWKRMPLPGEPQTDATELYGDFCERDYFRYRLLRSVPLAVLFSLGAIILMVAMGFPTNPYRGDCARRSMITTLIFSGATVVVLTFLVTDAMQLCRRFFGALRQANFNWNSAALTDIGRARGDNDRKRLESLLTMRLIVECSKTVGKLVRYPFIVVFLMVISRLTVFDYLDLNWSLVTIWLLLLTMAGWSAYDLRRSANATRNEILRRLRDRLAGMHDEAERKRQEAAIDAIQNEGEGAFGSPWNDPLTTALAIPFGGSTLWLLMQQFLPAFVL